MTLVVANCIDGAISMVSDTALTEDYRQKRFEREQGKPGILKAIVVSSELCICYAGGIEYAINAIQKIKQHIDELSLDNILDSLLQVHLNSSDNATNRPDFIIAHLENSIGSLNRIQSGKIERNIPTCWVGDKDAFENYQKFYHTYKDSDRKHNPELPTWSVMRSAMSAAMKEVIDNALDETVSGFFVPVASTSKGFEYMTYMFSMVKQKSTVSNEWTSLDLVGDVQGGSYTCVLLSPTESDVAAIGVYIFQPRLGYFFNPLGPDGNWLLTGGTQKQFVEYIKSNYGITLEGIMVG